MIRDIRVKRVYETPSEEDGLRVLVDRLWPRGLHKESAHIDSWRKDLAPSPELRKWFDHQASRFEEFSARYVRELDENDEVPDFLEHTSAGLISLLYAAKDARVNHAVILKSYLISKLHKKH